MGIIQTHPNIATYQRRASDIIHSEDVPQILALNNNSWRASRYVYCEPTCQVAGTYRGVNVQLNYKI